MPLILLTGYPVSGKSTKSKELIGLLKEKIESNESLSKYSITYHSDESLDIPHSDYINSNDERKARSKIISVVKRDLSKNNIVIVDSLNYIKGFRYQLHCEVKNLMTTYCVIHCLNPVNECLNWNKLNSHPNTWDPELIRQLAQRYEEPNPHNRWDSPLFPILASQDQLDLIKEDIFMVIFPHLYKNVANRETDKLLQSLKPNVATVLKPAAPPDLFQFLDTETTYVLKKIMNHLRSNVVSGSTRVFISESKDVNDSNCMFIDLPCDSIGIAQLQRIRRQFIAMNKLRNMEQSRIIPLFVDYLNKNLSTT